MIPSGTYNIGPDNARLLVHTYREGMAAKLGHDLVIEVTRWSATIDVDGDNLSRSSGKATVDARSFKVVSGTGGMKPLSEGDKDDILKNLDKTLKTDKFPEISFSATRVNAMGDKVTVEGDLTITGNTRPARMEISLGGAQATGKMTVVQTDFGVKPYSKLGAIKVRDAIDITFEGAVPQG